MVLGGCRSFLLLVTTNPPTSKLNDTPESQGREGLLGGLWGGLLFKAGHLLTFPTYWAGAYLRWVLIQGWVLN